MHDLVLGSQLLAPPQRCPQPGFFGVKETVFAQDKRICRQEIPGIVVKRDPRLIVPAVRLDPCTNLSIANPFGVCNAKFRLLECGNDADDPLRDIYIGCFLSSRSCAARRIRSSSSSIVKVLTSIFMGHLDGSNALGGANSSWRHHPRPAC